MRRHEGPDDPLDQTLAALGPEERVRQRERGLFDELTRGATRAVIFGCGPLGRVVLSGARGAAVEVVAFADNNARAPGPRSGWRPDHVSGRRRRDPWPRRVLRCRRLQQRRPQKAAARPRLRTGRPVSGILLAIRARVCRRRVSSCRTGFSRTSLTCAPATSASQTASRERSSPRRSPGVVRSTTIDCPPRIARPTSISLRTSCASRTRKCSSTAAPSTATASDCFASKAGGAFRHIYACEPDAANRRALEGYLSSLPAGERDRVSVLPVCRRRS